MQKIVFVIILASILSSKAQDMNERKPVGTVTMNADRSLTLDLRANDGKGAVGLAQFNIKPGEQGYDETIARLRGIAPGESKLLYE